MRVSRTERFQPGKLGDFLEAAYRLETDDQTWLAEVVQKCQAVWGREGPTHAHIYDASDIRKFRVHVFHVSGFCDESLSWMDRGLEFLTPSLIARTYRSSAGDMMMNVALPEMAPLVRGLAAVGILDALNINGLDPAGLGVHIALWTRIARDPPPAQMAFYRRMAHHLGAAHRCRRRLRESYAAAATVDATVGAEAILDARNRVIHATGSAKARGARSDLVETAKARDSALSSKPAAQDAFQRWWPLTRARWTLVDRFERNGVRYVVARENQTQVRSLHGLSDRERQVVAYLAIGQSTKETAYALGISDATVRVLLARAATKLGVRSRTAFLDHADVRPLRPDGTPGNAPQASPPQGRAERRR